MSDHGGALLVERDAPCIDIWVTYSYAERRISALSIEWATLPQLLREFGLDELAARVERADALDEQLTEYAAAFEALVTGPAQQTGSWSDR